jgi:N-acetyltransferase
MPFDRQPTLTGSLLTLRPLRADDWDALFAAASDPLIWELHPDSDRYKEEVFRGYFKDAQESGGALVASDNASGAIIGASRYHDYDEARSRIEIGWSFLARKYWGGAYNGEMKRLMLEHAFQYVDTVEFYVGIGNLRSQRALEKIGGVRSGAHIDRRGRPHVVFEISKPFLAADG